MEFRFRIRLNRRWVTKRDAPALSTREKQSEASNGLVKTSNGQVQGSTTPTSRILKYSMRRRSGKNKNIRPLKAWGRESRRLFEVTQGLKKKT